jgi:hypothetical protein
MHRFIPCDRERLSRSLLFLLVLFSLSADRIGLAAAPPRTGQRDQSSAASTSEPAAAPADATGAQPATKAPVASTPAAPPAVFNDCDYWIVSSRGCDGRVQAGDGGRCLSFFRRTCERTLVAENRDTFLASIRADRPVCFVVHGSYNWWRDVVAESRKINRWVRSALPGAPLQVVIFTWPSDGNLPFVFPVDIAILGRKSAAHSIYLATLITQLPKDQRVVIVGHSHGARTATAALHLLGGGTLEGGQSLPPGFSVPDHLRAVLLAAAIDHQWLNPGDRYGQALLVPEQVLLIRNSRDATLAVYPMRKGLGERALGKEGLNQQDRFVLGPLGSKIVELDAADFANWHHSFADYHQHPELSAAMVPFVYFEERTPVTVGPAIGPAVRILPKSQTAKAPPKPSDTAPATRQTGLERSKSSDERSKAPVKADSQPNAVELRFEK